MHFASSQNLIHAFSLNSNTKNNIQFTDITLWFLLCPYCFFCSFISSLFVCFVATLICLVLIYCLTHTHIYPLMLQCLVFKRFNAHSFVFSCFCCFFSKLLFFSSFSKFCLLTRHRIASLRHISLTSAAKINYSTDIFVS